MTTYSSLDLSVGLIVSIPILPSCLETSLEIPESHSSNSLILSFLAIRLTITVTGFECLLSVLLSSFLLLILCVTRPHSVENWVHSHSSSLAHIRSDSYSWSTL